MILLFCLFPLASYCLFLSFLNRGRHPVLVRGAWDFAGVLFAVSGFLILGGPAILNGLYENRRLAWVLGGRISFLPGLQGNDWFIWAGLWFVYYTGLVWGVAYLIWRRRRYLSIYNLEVEQIDAVLLTTLRRLGLEGVRMGSRLVIEAPSGWEMPRAESADVASPPAREGGTRSAPARTAPSAAAQAVGPTTLGILELDPFVTMNHVTLRWPEQSGLIHQEVEAELARTLAETPPAHDSVGGWFLALACSFFCVTILGALILMAAVLFRIVR